MPLRISQLFVYPIKSLGGIALDTSEITQTGLKYDRRWMLVDPKNRFISQRENATLALLRIRISNQGLDVYHKDRPENVLTIPFLNNDEISQLKRTSVEIWDDTCDAAIYPDFYADWFSAVLDLPCKLVYMDDTVRREVDKDYAFKNEITSFSDAFPILIIGQASLDDLNSRLAEPLPINRFRPNLVFEGGYPFQEDEMPLFMINGIEYKGVKPCARCNIPTIDQESGISSFEPTRTLASYRLKNKKILFGQNVLVGSTGSISVGDLIHLP